MLSEQAVNYPDVEPSDRSAAGTTDAARLANRPSLAELDREAWNRLIDVRDDPFLSQPFLAALERHGAVSPRLGWAPRHLLLGPVDKPTGGLAAYLKAHSFGDFVYDWDWAEFAAARGQSWYPKLVVEVPYSPVSGRRLLQRQSSAEVAERLAAGLIAETRAMDLPCVQVNHCTGDEAELLTRHGFLLRNDLQLHWHNRGYTGFDDFLAELRHKPRKNIRAERRKLAATGVQHRWLNGHEMDENALDIAVSCYRRTFHEKGNFPALSRQFFREINRELGPRVLYCQALRDGTPVATAIFLRSRKRLYGRYWGSLDDIPGLHFETCFYQGIEYCIANDLDAFEPGAGGDHKAARGFLPQPIYNCTWVANRELRRQLRRWLQAERPLRADQYAHCRAASPFHDAVTDALIPHDFSSRH